MTTILYIIALLVTNGLTGFLVFKGVQLGLRWQVEVRQERPPTMESPIKNPIEHIQQAKQDTETKNLVSEWLNGAEESR